jgi:hypothetical protein
MVSKVYGDSGREYLTHITGIRGESDSTRDGIRDSATSGIPVKGKYFVTVTYTSHMNDISSFAVEG